MAYTIISQNNSTTTLSDGVNTITVPSRVNLTSGNFTIVEVNNNMATLEDGDGNVYRDIPCVATLAGEGGGGGSVDYSKTVQKAKTLPTASASNVDQVFMYTGATDANYTTNYIYKNVKTSTYTGTVSFEAATLSSSTIACSGSDFATFVAEWGSGDITTITHGTLTYDQSGGLLVFVGKDSEETTVCTFQLYTEDYQDAGFTITGTLQDGDVVAFTCSITEASATYTWTRVDVQPTPSGLPDQTGHSGEFLTTDGTDASWATVNALQNTATGTDALTIGGTPTSSVRATNIGIGSEATGPNSLVIGKSASASGNSAIAIGIDARATGEGSIAISGKSLGTGYNNSIAIGSKVSGNKSIAIMSGSTSYYNSITAVYSVVLGYIYNPASLDSNSFYVGLGANQSQTVKLLDSNGTIPADRLVNAINKYSSMPTAASTNEGWIVQFTGTTDSTYTHGHLYECVSDGQDPATYSWTEVSMGGGGSSYTAGTGIDITSGVISVENPVVMATGSTITAPSTDSTNGLAIGNNAFAGKNYGTGNNTLAIGNSSSAKGNSALAIGHNASATSAAVAVGYKANATSGVAIGVNLTAGNHGIIIGANNTNTQTGDANAFDIVLDSIKYNLVSADGTIPAARHASLPAADGTYTLQLVIADGVPTLSWVAV